MTLFKIAAVAAVLALPLVSLAAPAAAATASNSQAGANGHDKNMQKNVGMHAKAVRHRRRM